MELLPPRYEFRVFADNLVPVFQSMKELAGEPFIRESKESYIISEHCWDTNIKIRDGKLDLKIFMQEREGLEQWVPKDKMDFPVNRETIERLLSDDLFFEEADTLPNLIEESYSLDTFLELMKSLEGIRVVEVNKKRYGFESDEVIMEFAEVVIDGQPRHTVAMESKKPEDTLKMVHYFDLDRRPNTNYLEEIKHIIGMVGEEGEHC
jgi:hypothetical protein